MIIDHRHPKGEIARMDAIQMTQGDYDALIALIERVSGRQAEAKQQMGESSQANAGDGWHSDDFKRTIVDEAVQGLRASELRLVADAAVIVTPAEQNVEVDLGSLILLQYDAFQADTQLPADQPKPKGRQETLLLVGYAARGLKEVMEVSLRAPLGQQLKGKKYGERVTVGEESAMVLDILSPRETEDYLARL